MRYFTYVLTLLLLIPTTLPAQNMRPIFDARLDLKPTEPSTAELNWLKRHVLPDAHSHWQEQEDSCEEGFSVKDVAAGAFTKANATQKAYMYQFCETRRGMSNDGIAIVEDKQLVAHLMYEGTWSSALGALPDINRNGLSEILITGNDTNQGYGHESIFLIELVEGDVNTLGRITVYDSDCGATGAEHTMTFYKIDAEPTATPIFYRETFKQGCNNDGKPQKAGKRERIDPEADETDYFLD